MLIYYFLGILSEMNILKNFNEINKIIPSAMLSSWFSYCLKKFN